MTTELSMLLGVVAILFASNLIAAMAGIRVIGVNAALGNRDDIPTPFPGFAGRAGRNAGNHAFGLLLFAPLVLIAAQIDVSNSTTILAAQMYFFARLAHAALYIFGVPYIRTLAFGVGVVALIMFAWGAFV